MHKSIRFICGTLILIGTPASSILAQDLERGGFEIRGSGGINGGASPYNHTGDPGWRIEGAYGLSRFIAVTAGYTHDNLQTRAFFVCGTPFPIQPGQSLDLTNCNSSGIDSALHEFMGGVRFSAANHTRLTPYVRFDLGAVRQTSHSSSSTFNPGPDITKFAFSPGAGVDLQLTHHLGVGAEAEYVKPNRLGGFYRVMGGVFFRF